MSQFMKPRVSVVTIGQTPRSDLVPDLRSYTGDTVELVEFGALDELSCSEIAELAPSEADQALVTRLRDGTETVVSKAWMERRLRVLIEEIESDSVATVLLCTGSFPNLHPRIPLFLEAQRIVDAGVSAFLQAGSKLGVMVPLERQMAESHIRHHPTRFAHVSPYGGAEVHEAAKALRGCDLVVMHCIGYTERMRESVADVTHKPVLLARRLVGAAIAQIA